jgi:hypothetical protein
MDYSQIWRSLTPMHASLHYERVSHRPFGAPDRHSAFTPERVGIESDDGTVVESFEQPRASFAGHTAETRNTLQLAYFAGAAMWTYLTQPFPFAMPGFRVTATLTGAVSASCNYAGHCH